MKPKFERIYSLHWQDVRTDESTERVAMSQVSFLRQFEEIFSIACELSTEFQILVNVEKVEVQE